MIFQGFSLMELDRFLALYWNMLYYERVTNQRTFNFILMVKFVTMSMFFMYFWASDMFYSHFPCQFIISQSFIPVIISQTFYIASTIFVCIYVFKIARKQENAVAPVFVIGQDQNQAQVETPQSNIAKLTKIGLKVNILSLIQLVPECPRLLALIAFYASDSHDDVIVKILHVLTLISLILAPILINRRLNHYSN